MSLWTPKLLHSAMVGAFSKYFNKYCEYYCEILFPPLAATSSSRWKLI